MQKLKPSALRGQVGLDGASPPHGVGLVHGPSERHVGVEPPREARRVRTRHHEERAVIPRPSRPHDHRAIDPAVYVGHEPVHVRRLGLYY